MKNIPKEVKLKILRNMYTIRRFELKMTEIFKEKIRRGEPVGALHSCEGQEAISAAVSACLRDDDYVFSTHRGHGHAIAKGVELKKVVSELLGKETGCSHGRGGSMHLFDVSVGLMGGNGIVGGGLPLALGTAYSAQYRGTDQVTVCYFGDGAVSQGSFHESLNMAAIWKYPIIYVCENNLYAATTHFDKQSPIENVADRAVAYGIEGVVVDGNDVVAVHTAVLNAVKRARDGAGPTLLECKTYRHHPHCMVIPEHRNRQEVESWKGRDPITIFETKLLEGGDVSQADLDEVSINVNEILEEAVDFAINSPLPDPANVADGMWVI